MTHKIALSLALFASLGLTACTVDAPTPEDFNYSFLDELPGAPSSVDSFTTSKQPLASQISIEFRDSLQGTDDVSEKVAAVPLLIEGVRLATSDAEGNLTWRDVASKPTELDLMTLADGETKRIAFGPVPEGQYAAIAFKVASSEVVLDDGDSYELALPGAAVIIEREFYLQAFEEHDFVVQFRGLRGVEEGALGWSTDPSPGFYPATE